MLVTKSLLYTGSALQVNYVLLPGAEIPVALVTDSIMRRNLHQLHMNGIPLNNLLLKIAFIAG